MSECTFVVAESEQQQAVKSPLLFQVWIDLDFDEGEPDWWWNSPPKPLANALDESQIWRAKGWTTKVLPEGINPRADGRWNNP